MRPLPGPRSPFCSELRNSEGTRPLSRNCGIRKPGRGLGFISTTQGCRFSTGYICSARVPSSMFLSEKTSTQIASSDALRSHRLRCSQGCGLESLEAIKGYVQPYRAWTMRAKTWQQGSIPGLSERRHKKTEICKYVYIYTYMCIYTYV